ncbi:transcription factor IIIA [Bemisia tabaci]|uniref:transcription factor IIIA n=1 Tax=Bemisia tabaci TaxID=7038 RepID=UPI0008F9A021|nr:PREDICTED: transcription factor IIIA-like [Bemisia tabaci]
MKHFCPYIGCKASFPRPSKLRLHIKKIHLKEQLFVCTYSNCDKNYTQAAHLKRHIEINHERSGGTPFQAKCSFAGCKAVLSTKWGLVRHERTHMSKDEFKCLHCSRSFTKKVFLEKHMVTHHSHGQPHYQCSQCPLAFNTHHRYHQHMSRTHAVYFCNRAGCNMVRFEDHNKLRAHESSIHFPVKFQCAECSKKFSRRMFLVEHISSEHEGLSFQCPHKDCERTFSYRRNLNTHLKSHENIRFSCAHCGNELSTKQKLRQHIEKIHQKLGKPRTFSKSSKSVLGNVLGLYHDHDKLMNVKAESLVSNSVSKIDPLRIETSSDTDKLMNAKAESLASNSVSEIAPLEIESSSDIDKLMNAEAESLVSNSVSEIAPLKIETSSDNEILGF